MHFSVCILKWMKSLRSEEYQIFQANANEESTDSNSHREHHTVNNPKKGDKHISPPFQKRPIPQNKNIARSLSKKAKKRMDRIELSDGNKRCE